ncbi:nucleotidyltransferase domain-containing protein, partial [bacterium]|nr:nucleotidyltransferase domain-containing protein [bacterium]
MDLDNFVPARERQRRRAEKLRETLLAALPRLVARGPELVVLFGSVARKRAFEDSDIDLLVVMEIEGNPPERASKVWKILDINEVVNAFVLTPEEFDRAREQTPLVRTALEEG